MKKNRIFISFMLVITLFISSLGSFVNAQEINQEDLSSIQIEDSEYGVLDIKAIVEEEKITTEVYNGDEFLGKTIVYKTDGRIEEFDSLGNKQTSHIGDYLKNTDGTKVSTEIFVESDIYKDEEFEYKSLKAPEQNAKSRYSIPSGYKNIRSEYSSKWKARGYLYRNTKVTYGKERIYTFSKGTKVATAVSLFLSLGEFDVRDALIAVGISIVGGLIDVFNAGKYKTKTIRDDLLVVVNNKLGLKTYQTTVNADIYSTTTGKKNVKRIRTEGDGRTYSDMIHIGIYNIVVLGW